MRGEMLSWNAAIFNSMCICLYKSTTAASACHQRRAAGWHGSRESVLGAKQCFDHLRQRQEGDGAAGGRVHNEELVHGVHHQLLQHRLQAVIPCAREQLLRRSPRLGEKLISDARQEPICRRLYYLLGCPQVRQKLMQGLHQLGEVFHAQHDAVDDPLTEHPKIGGTEYLDKNTAAIHHCRASDTLWLKNGFS